ncbi:hypothetical protein [Streptomyces diastaticus]|uniref:hypothetical protein n=1 Tax=Streptomyces diastaticus TaxID=1956 RepID=UPI0038306628
MKSTVTSPAADGSAADVRSVVRGAITALYSGSVVLAGRACRCVGTAARWAWDQASIDTGATAERQAKADRKAQKAAATIAAKAAKARKAADEDDEDDDEDGVTEAADVVAAPVAPVRRSGLEALAMLAFGAALAGGALATVVPLIAPHVQALAPWRSAALTVGSLAWMVAAWMVSPPPAPAPAPAEDAEDQEEAASPADLLARHVLERLAELEAAGRRGVHVTALISSAEAAGLLAPGAMDKVRMRAWLPASGIPVTKSVKVRGDVDYGLSIAHVTAALGMSPGEALRRLSGDAPETPAEAPSGEAPEPPAAPSAEGAAEAPAPAPVEALPPARLALVQPLPEEGAPEGARGAA